MGNITQVFYPIPHLPHPSIVQRVGDIVRIDLRLVLPGRHNGALVQQIREVRARHASPRGHNGATGPGLGWVKLQSGKLDRKIMEKWEN